MWNAKRYFAGMMPCGVVSGGVACDIGIEPPWGTRLGLQRFLNI